MCLLLLGPLLGQGLVLGQSANAWQWLDELACSDDAASPLSPAHANEWAKCGYCTLLLSSPALSTSASLLPPRFVAPPVVSPFAAPALPPAGVFPGAQSRAPPRQV
jgi:hypothetical protein